MLCLSPNSVSPSNEEAWAISSKAVLREGLEVCFTAQSLQEVNDFGMQIGQADDLADAAIGQADALTDFCTGAYKAYSQGISPV